MRLLGAELRKLRRPLVAATALGLIALCSLLAWVGAGAEAGQSVRVPGDQEGFAEPPSDCAAYGLPEGEACRRAIAAARQGELQARMVLGRDAAAARTLRDPLAAGWFAAGQLASLPGALALLALAAAHAGEEFSAGTLAAVLTHQGRRWRLLAAKAASLWLAGAGMLAVTWAALAVQAPVLRAVHGAPVPPLGLDEAAALAGGRAGRALLVLAAFALLGLVAAVLARSALGTLMLGLGALATAFALGPLGRSTLPAWVAGWMRFGETGVVPDHVWSTGVAPGAPILTSSAGLQGLTGFLLVAGLFALAWFGRADVRV